MAFDEYYTITDLSDELNVPKVIVEELCREYEIYLRRVSENNQIKFHSSSAGMLRHIMDQLEEGVDRDDIIASLGFSPTFLCSKDKKFCQ